MKKLKKLLATISAIAMTITAFVVPVLAEAPLIEDALYYLEYDSTTYPSPTYYKMGMFIDTDGEFKYFNTGFPRVIVTLAEGEELVIEDESLTVTKIDKSFIDSQEPSWGWSFLKFDGEITDNMYLVSGLPKYNIEKRKEFCHNMMKEENVISANLFFSIEVGEFGPEGAGLNFEGFESTNFTVDLRFENEESAKEFDFNSVEGLNENLFATYTEENTIYFQLNDEISSETIANVLNTIEKNEDISVYVYGNRAEDGNISNGLMSAFDNGDVNFDTNINLYDAIDIAKYLMNSKEFNGEQLFLGDVNEDGTCDLYDAIEIAKTLIK